MQVVDHAVPHESKVPANAPARVDLFVREFDGRAPGEAGKAVLMLHGKSVSGLAGFDLAGDHPIWGDYSWARQLARRGFDVFVMDLQGSGCSPRPMMDLACNTDPATCQDKLIPNPLDARTPVKYTSQLNNTDSDIAELETVVEFIRGLRNVPKVALVGWSAAAFILGPFVLRDRRDRVESLFLLAPIFPPNGLTNAPGSMPLSKPPERFGFPMTIQTKQEFDDLWKKEIDLGAERTDGILDVVWQSIMATDDRGRQWGGTERGRPTGVMRIRNAVWWGWNTAQASALGILGSKVPVLLVYGMQDLQAQTVQLRAEADTFPGGMDLGQGQEPAVDPAVVGVQTRPREGTVLGQSQDPAVDPAEVEVQTRPRAGIDLLGQDPGNPQSERAGPPFSVRALYDAIPGERKIIIRIDNAGHFMPWEKQARVFLHNLSIEWITYKAIDNNTGGIFHMTSDGRISPERRWW